MAKLRIPADLVVGELFGDVFVTINGCSFDARDQTLLLDVQGGDVPDVEEVVAEVTVARRSVTFKPRETPTTA